MTFSDPVVISQHVRHQPPANATKFTRVKYDDISLEEGEWLVKNMIPADGYGFLAGPSQAGKSFLALEWSLRISAGQAVMCHRARQSGVVYVASEAPKGVKKRVEAWRRSNPAVKPAFELVSEAPDLRSEADIDELVAVIRAARAELASRGFGVGLVVIDTLAASMPGGDENNGADMSALLANVQRLGREFGGFVLIVSHTGKDESRGLRGWSGQFAGADCVFMLSHDKVAGVRSGEVAKLKDGEAGERFGFCLNKVVLGEDGDGDEISSAVITYEDVQDAARKVKPMSAPERVVLTALKYVVDNGDSFDPPQVPGTQQWQRAVRREDVRVRAMASGLAGDDVKPGTARQRFYRALEGLVAKSMVRIEEETLWLL